MLLAYIDESERDETHYFLSALIGTPAQWRILHKKLEQILIAARLSFSPFPHTIELHASSMMNGRDEWRKIPRRLTYSIYKQSLLAINDSGICGYVEGIDIQQQKKRYAVSTMPPREVAFSYILERVNDHAIRLETDIRVFADNHHEADKARSNFTKYQKYGTFGYKSSKLTAIIENITFLDSQLSIGLQAADLVTYIYNRNQTIQEKDPRATRLKFELWQAIKPALMYPRGSTRIWP